MNYNLKPFLSKIVAQWKSLDSGRRCLVCRNNLFLIFYYDDSKKRQNNKYADVTQAVVLHHKILLKMTLSVCAVSFFLIYLWTHLHHTFFRVNKNLNLHKHRCDFGVSFLQVIGGAHCLFMLFVIILIILSPLVYSQSWLFAEGFLQNFKPREAEAWQTATGILVLFSSNLISISSCFISSLLL